ncbi:MAG: hypothetical protein JWQ84_952 [Mucilaginibacter sp.]|nr:hypothetical protein [Mucilaginibacter sp.]
MVMSPLMIKNINSRNLQNKTCRVPEILYLRPI